MPERRCICCGLTREQALRGPPPGSCRCASCQSARRNAPETRCPSCLTEYLDLLPDNEVNEDCPDECDAEHAAPQPNPGGVWTCPRTRRTHQYCTACDEWFYALPTYWSRGAGESYCDPAAHGFERCHSCRNWVDLESDEGYYDENPGPVYCARCYNRRRLQAERQRPAVAQVCRMCNTPAVHLDLETEEFLCQHQAEERKKLKKPVLEVEQAA